MSWKDTLNLPETAFPMKANLVVREPEILRRWKETGLYGRIRAARKGRTPFVLHDGPPYANGEGHVGNFRIKVLKDVVVRFATMKGHDAPFVPGWDCHGLPIEHNVMKDLGGKARALPPAEVRKLCRAYAERFVAIQRDNYERFGVAGEWAHPYLTMSPGYEAAVLDVFAGLVERGYVTRGLRTIHWCVHCRTALAEAELEYGPETSPSIHVRFAVEPGSLAVVGGEPASVVIWTTTPWTLPANVAVAVHPELNYAVVVHDGPDREQRAVVALPLVTRYLAAVGATEHEVPLVVPGRALVGTRLRHPFLDRVVPVVGADYVSAEDGTGCVHTAPGHGADDFATGRREGLPILCPVGPDGLFTEEAGVPALTGTHVFKADGPILALLRERGALAAESKLEHSYPHCWRCHGPVIFRATEQWFVQVDHERLRERALEACAKARWIPAWGLQRITSMLRDRPDWCISRQRTWGVPIPALYCEACGAVTRGADHARVVRHAQTVFAREGADAWFTHDVSALTPPGLRCPCGGTAWRRETDIFDVWFESGSSWRAVCTPEHGLRFPADVYFEGHDQHRGWFQSSLLPAVAVAGELPFRTCVTSGFFNDETGDKVSKSRGGMKDLTFDVLTKQIGADICRLFFVSSNYFDDVVISRRLFDAASEQYRKLRNTLRFLLGAVAGYEAPQALPAGRLLAIDRWAIAAMDDVAERVDRAYLDHDFCRVSQILREFMDADLSAFYLDLVKDRLYCSAPASAEYASVRQAIAHLVRCLVRLWAPILPFTCEEAWQHLPPGLREVESVHLALWEPPGKADRGDLAVVAELRRVRSAIQQQADVLRKSGGIGANQEIAATVRRRDRSVALQLDDAGREDVMEVLGVAEFAEDAPGAEDGDQPPAETTARIHRSSLPRCERCRRHRPDVAVRSGGRDALCVRCEAWRSVEPTAEPAA